MKFSILIFLAWTLMTTVLSSQPKSTTVYYAKPLHPMKGKPAKPKPMVYKVIIHDQPAQKQQQEIYKIIHLPQQAGGHGGSGGHQQNGGSKEAVKIFKIIHVKQQAGSGDGGQHSKWS